jgi:urease accessory protein UreF
MMKETKALIDTLEEADTALWIESFSYSMGRETILLYV